MNASEGVTVQPGETVPARVGKEQVRATVPVKPLVGVMVPVPVPPEVATVMPLEGPVSEKPAEELLPETAIVVETEAAAP